MTPIVVILQNGRLYANYVDQMFVELGYSVGGAFCTAGDAKHWRVGNDPDIALINAEVQDGDCIELARRLKARAPLVMHSTVSPVGKPADHLLTAGRFVKKSAHRDRIVGAITAALRTS